MKFYEYKNWKNYFWMKWSSNFVRFDKFSVFSCHHARIIISPFLISQFNRFPSIVNNHFALLYILNCLFWKLKNNQIFSFFHSHWNKSQISATNVLVLVGILIIFLIYKDSSLWALYLIIALIKRLGCCLHQPTVISEKIYID